MLEKRAILITGASRGIGAAVARVCHREGATVVLHYSNSADQAIALAEELTNRVHLVRADLRAPSERARLWGETLEAVGDLDVLVNNAGAWLSSPITNQNEWDLGWQENLDLNLLAPADLTRRAILHFRGRGPALDGIIVNITSRSAHRGDDADHLAYGAAKAGLLALTKGVARAHGRDRVLAYAVAPGWVATDIAAAEPSVRAVNPDLPLGEITPPDDVAEMVAFLASGRSPHTTGATIDITGADYVR